MTKKDTPLATDDNASTASAPESLRNRVVLVTGAAHRIGDAVARELGAAGTRLALADSDERRVIERAATLAGRDVEAIALPFDPAQPAQCEDVVSAVVAHFGHLDALVQATDGSELTPRPGLDTASWQRALAVHVGAPLLLARHAATAIAAYGSGGHIVHIAGDEQLENWPDLVAWRACQSWLQGQSQALRAELHAQRIHVFAVVPGGLQHHLVPDRVPALDIEPGHDPLEIARAVCACLQEPVPGVVGSSALTHAAQARWP